MEQTATIERAGRRLEDLQPAKCGVCMDSGFVFLGIVDDGEETYETVECWRCGRGAP